VPAALEYLDAGSVDAAAGAFPVSLPEKAGFMVDRRGRRLGRRGRDGARRAAFWLALRLGGTVSGEHGLGWVKRDQLDRQWTPTTIEIHRAIKRAFEPKGLMNPGKKD